jgi:ribosomal protein S27AE
MSEINVDRVLKMEEEYHSAKEETIKQLLARQKDTAEQLKALGYGGKPSKVTAKKKPCSKCGASDHDARAHRGESSKAARPTPSAKTAS